MIIQQSLELCFMCLIVVFQIIILICFLISLIISSGYLMIQELVYVFSSYLMIIFIKLFYLICIIIFEEILKMALEATLIMLDNSSYALNGDYLPTRWESQMDAASLLIQSKLQANLQSSVGIGLMGGRQVSILCTMTSDQVKAKSYLFGIKIHGEFQFTKGLQIGALALKHRINETQKQRIVSFVGSKISQNEQTLKLLGKKFKKNGVAVDLICFGDCSQQQRKKVQEFIKAVDNEDNSHFVFIEPGEVYLSEKLMGTKIFSGNDSGMGNPGLGNMQDDPQMAAAIKASLQEHQKTLKVEEQSKAPQGQKKQQAVGQQQPTQQQLQRLAIQMSLQQMEKSQKKDEDKQKKQ